MFWKKKLAIAILVVSNALTCVPDTMVPKPSQPSILLLMASILTIWIYAFYWALTAIYKKEDYDI